MTNIAYPKSPLRGLKKLCLAGLILSLALSYQPVRPAYASTNYIDDFSVYSYDDFDTSFETGTPSTGLSYTCTNCYFMAPSVTGVPTYQSAPINQAITITARDGDDFDFTSIGLSSSEDLRVAGYGPEPFTINVAPSLLQTVVGPATPHRVTRVEITPGSMTARLDLHFDDVHVVLYDPEIDLQRPAGTSIPDGSRDDLGTLPLNFISLTYTLANTGDSDLTIGSVTASNLHNVSNFSVAIPPCSPVAPSNSVEFTIEFDIAGSGPFYFNLDIPSNDANESIYDLRILGVRDTEPPQLMSVSRFDPLSSTTSADSLTFRTTFNEDVQNVSPADFDATGTSAGVAGVEAVAAAAMMGNYPVSAGLWKTCAVRDDGGLACWGSSSYSPPPGIDFTMVSTGSYHICALRNNGSLACWGNDDYGQSSELPGTDFAMVSAGKWHSCALRNDGSLACWGRNTNAQASPPAGTDYAMVSSGAWHTCALKDDGSLACWGNVFASPPSGTGFTMVSTGFYQACALRDDGSIACWGNDDYGQSSPPSGSNYAMVSVGNSHACALRNDGSLACWGRNNEGQSSPPPGTDFTLVSAGYEHTCALKNDGSLSCWGRNDAGQASPPAGLTVNPVNAAVYDVTISGGDLAGLNGTVGLNLAAGQNITDLVGYALPAGEPSIDETYTVDNAPNLISFTRLDPATSLTNADGLMFLATFDEPVTNLDPADFAVDSASTTFVDTVIPDTPSTYWVIVQGGDLEDFNGTVGLNLAVAQDIADWSGHPLPAGEPSIDETYLLDNNAPEITSFARQTPAATPTNADTLVFRATFDDDVQNVDATDFTVSGTSATVTDVNAINASTYDLTVSGGDLAGFNGKVELDLAPGLNISDPAGNVVPSVEPGTDESYILDNDAPGITSFTRQMPTASPTNADTLVFRATFDEDVQNVDTSDLTVSGTTASVTGVTAVSASVYDLTVSGGDLAGLDSTVGLDLAGVQDISDLVGNTLPAGEPATDQIYLVDNDSPGIASFTRRTPFDSHTNADVLIFRTSFDEDVQDVDGGDFTVAGSTATVTAVTMLSARDFDVRIGGGNLAGLNGTVGLDLAVAQNITDLAGNPLPMGEPDIDETYLVDNHAPAPVIYQAFGQTDPAVTLPINFTIDFGEAVTGFDAGDLSFSGTAPGVPTATVTGGPQIYNTAVSGLTGDGTLTINFSAGAAQDAVGNTSAAPFLSDNQVTFDGDPEIDLQHPAGTSILDGGIDILGNRSIGRVSLTYTIDNAAGTDVLTIPSVTTSNLINVSGFSLDTPTPITVAGGQVTTFDLSFDVGVNGPFSLDLNVANNDGDEDPYSFTVTGTGTGGLPEIEVQRPAGTPIMSGSTDAFGMPGVGTVHQTYTLDNSAGTSQLDVIGVSASSLTNVSNFVVRSGIPISVPARTTGAVDISFDVLAEGPFSFDLAITNNDSDEGSYAFQVSGTALDLQVLMSGGTSPLDGAVLYEGPNTLSVQFNKDVQSAGGSGAADNPANYLLVEAGADGEHDTTSCALGAGDDDLSIPILSADYDPASRTATLDIAGGPLPNGRYRLLICGTTSVRDLFNIELNRGLSDTLISFLVTDRPSLPDTGFAPNQFTTLLTQPLEKQYHALGDLWLEIPSLGVRQIIIGVPQTSEGWDVAWLGSRIGYLAGTAFPTWCGNTGLTGHVYDANGQPGPFERLSQLKWGEQVLIHAFGQVYTYEVHSVQNWVKPTDSSLLTRHEDFDWITLITCRGYDESSGGYAYRSVVRAVLVKVETELH